MPSELTTSPGRNFWDAENDYFQIIAIALDINKAAVYSFANHL